MTYSARPAKQHFRQDPSHVNAGVRSLGNHQLERQRAVAELFGGVKIDARASVHQVSFAAGSFLRKQPGVVLLIHLRGADLPFALGLVPLERPALKVFAVEQIDGIGRRSDGSDQRQR